MHWFDIDRVGPFSLTGATNTYDFTDYPFNHELFRIFYHCIIRGKYLENGLKLLFPDYQENSILLQKLIIEIEMLLTLVEKLISSYIEAFSSNWQNESYKNVIRDFLYKRNKNTILVQEIADYRTKLNSSLKLQLIAQHTRHKSLTARVPVLTKKLQA